MLGSRSSLAHKATSRKTSASSTSLQSLALFNETQRLEMARQLAQRLMREGDTDKERLDRLFTLLACRPPTEVEQAACDGLLRSMRQRYADDAANAEALLSIGEAPRDTSLNPVEHAAWTQVATTVLASDVALLLY